MTDGGAAFQPGHGEDSVPARPRSAFVAHEVFGHGAGAVLVEPEVARDLRASAELARQERRIAGGLLYGRPWADDEGPYLVVDGFLESGPGENHADEVRPDTLVALADVRAAAGRVDEAEGLYRRAGVLGALRAHSAYGGFLLAARGDAAAAERELREAGRHDEPGWEFALGRFLVDDGRAAEARPYVARAATLGDDDAVTLLAEIDGEDPFDD